MEGKLNDKLELFKREIITKRIAVLGIGISNVPLIKYLGNLGVKVTAFDRMDRSELKTTIDELSGINVEYSLGHDYLKALKGFDVIFKTPKVRFDIPELLNEAEAGAEVTSEMEVFCKLCPARIIAVTGSDGKTTTTTLIYKILNRHGYKCWLGGNIGTPLLDRIDEIEASDMVVLELSSFQLHTMRNRIHTAVITNVTPNHLDVHKSMQEYTDAKKNIFLYQNENDTLVINYDNTITRSFAGEAAGKTVFFCRNNELANGMMLVDGKIVWRTSDKEIGIMDSSDILLPGVHNIENYLAAAAATIDFVSPQDIRDIAMSFWGVEHRNEFIKELNGVSFYNDSIGTSPTRTMASIKAFKGKVILIAGGYDKNIPYDAMGETLADNVKCLVLLGQTAKKIENALNKEITRSGKGADIPVLHCDTLEEAVKEAYERSIEKDIIILSPASASFDMFKNFEERGIAYKNIVNSLQQR
jgi:UDP-N-acetylmuramoylalanine--D-glutamate ligase